MTPLDWVRHDLGVEDVSVREIVLAFLAAPFLLAAFAAVCLFLWMLAPAP